MKEDHRTYRHNFCSCEKKAWKNSGLWEIWTLDLCDAGARYRRGHGFLLTFNIFFFQLKTTSNWQYYQYNLVSLDTAP